MHRPQLQALVVEERCVRSKSSMRCRRPKSLVTTAQVARRKAAHGMVAASVSRSAWVCPASLHFDLALADPPRQRPSHLPPRRHDLHLPHPTKLTRTAKLRMRLLLPCLEEAGDRGHHGTLAHRTVITPESRSSSLDLATKIFNAFPTNYPPLSFSRMPSHISICKQLL